MSSFDVIVLGAGPGGYVAAIRAAQHGLRTALVEPGPLGGTCLNRGCIPTKALLESAGLYAHLRRKGRELGLSWDALHCNYSAVVARKDRIVARLRKGIEHLVQSNGLTLLAGTGRLLGGGQVGVMTDGGDAVYTAEHIVLATGSRPRMLPGLVADGERIVTSDHLVAVTELPASLLIVGAGAIGMEFASLYADLDVPVTVIEVLPEILPLEDPEAAATLRKILTKRNVQFLLGARVSGVQHSESGVEVTAKAGASETTVTGAQLLVATGRAPLVEGLGLEAAGVDVFHGVITVDEQYRTTARGVYAIGDLIGTPPLAHVAEAEGIRCADAIAGQAIPPWDSQSIPMVTYTRPSLASVGLHEAAARAAGHAVRVGTFPFRALGRTLIAAEDEGFVKIVADAESGAVLGLTVLGPHAAELVMEGVLLRSLGGTLTQWAAAIHPHPSFSEALWEAAHAALGKGIHQ